MSETVECPSCSTVNKPDQVRCRACGRRLDGSESAKESRTVVLQRVMGGEVFTAVLGDAAKKPVPAASPAGEIPEAAAAPVDEEEETRRARVALAQRLAKDASASGQRFKPYVSERPRHVDTDEGQRAVGHQLESAAKAFREKRFENAIEHLLKAIAKEDGDPRFWTLLGEAYLRLERPYKAAVGYLRALELEPKSGSAWLGLSRAIKAAGDLSGALEALDRTVLINPKIAEAWSERGLVLEGLHNEAEAVRSFSRALEIRSDHKIARERYEQLAPKIAATEVVPEETAAKASGRAEPPAPIEEDLPDFKDLTAVPAATPGAAPPKAAPKKETRPHPARVQTFVEGLDETIGGGIPWGHVVLVEGSPGTMKSSVGFSILLNNAVKDGMHCLYLSLEERTSSLLKQMGSLGLPFHVDQGTLVVLDPRAAKGLLGEHPEWVEAFRRAVRTIKEERGLDLLVIDSLEALEILAKFKDRRREIFRLFEWLRDLDITAFVVTERPDWVIAGHVIQGRWDEDFLADGVVHLRQHLVSDLEVQRRLRVVKMRGTKHETGYMALVLDDGRFKVTRAMSP